MNGTTIRPGRRLPAARALALAAAAVAALTGCEPTGDGRLNAAAVAFTTDRTATSTFKRLGVEVRWLSCTSAPGSAPPAGAGYATVDCEGETAGGESITLRGRVTEERAGVCVRGDLAARVGGKAAFDAEFLGDCTQPRPSRRAPEPTPTVTVTVTRTVTPP
ncbi:hypothetical protein [Streptomyces sp. NPDC001889]